MILQDHRIRHSSTKPLATRCSPRQVSFANALIRKRPQELIQFNQNLGGYTRLYRQTTYLFGSADSGLLAHPVPSLGTSETLGSLPLFSAFKLGRLAGGGMRRAEATLPRDCKPWRGATTKTNARADQGASTHFKMASSATSHLQIRHHTVHLYFWNLGTTLWNERRAWSWSKAEERERERERKLFNVSRGQITRDLRRGKEGKERKKNQSL